MVYEAVVVAYKRLIREVDGHFVAEVFGYLGDEGYRCVVDCLNRMGCGMSDDFDKRLLQQADTAATKVAITLGARAMGRQEDETHVMVPVAEMKQVLDSLAEVSGYLRAILGGSVLPGG